MPNLKKALDASGRLPIHVLTCAGPYFALERWILTEPHIEPDHPWRCMTVSNIGTPVRIEYRSGSETLATGESYIIPAALSGGRSDKDFGENATNKGKC